MGLTAKELAIVVLFLDFSKPSSKTRRIAVKLSVLQAVQVTSYHARLVWNVN